MPLLKTSDRDLVRIELPEPGEWIEVKRHLGKDDEREVQRRTLSGQKLLAGSDVYYDIGEMMDHATFATLEVAAKRWSFTDPLTPANLRALDDASMAVIIEKLNELYPAPRTEDEVQDLSEPSAPSLSVVEPTQQNSAG